MTKQKVGKKSQKKQGANKKNLKMNKRGGGGEGLEKRGGTHAMFNRSNLIATCTWQQGDIVTSSTDKALLLKASF